MMAISGSAGRNVTVSPTAEAPAATVDAEDLPGGAARPAAQQVNDGLGYVVRLAMSLEVDRDGIHGDAALCELPCGHAGQRIYGRSAYGIGRGVSAGPGHRDARDIHDGTVVTQVASRLPIDEEGRQSVAPTKGLEPLEFDLSQRARRRTTADDGLDDGVDATARLYGLEEQALDVQLIGHIGAYGLGRSPAGQDRLDGRLGLSLVVGVVDDH